MAIPGPVIGHGTRGWCDASIGALAPLACEWVCLAISILCQPRDGISAGVRTSETKRNETSCPSACRGKHFLACQPKGGPLISFRHAMARPLTDREATGSTFVLGLCERGSLWWFGIAPSKTHSIHGTTAVTSFLLRCLLDADGPFFSSSFLD